MRFLVASLLAAVSISTAEAQIPPNAEKYLPTLISEQQAHWPTAPTPWFIAGQVEQESCVTLKSKKCWTPYAELKVSDGHGGLREWGVGFGQTTKTKKFDNFEVWRNLDKSMNTWTVDNIYDPVLQLRGLVFYDKLMYNSMKSIPEGRERIAFSLAAYNGGIGGVLQDRRVCAETEGCDVSKWFGNVEKTSNKAKVAVHGYGKSFFEINRSYVTNILQIRGPKYAKFWNN